MRNHMNMIRSTGLDRLDDAYSGDMMTRNRVVMPSIHEWKALPVMSGISCYMSGISYTDNFLNIGLVIFHGDPENTDMGNYATSDELYPTKYDATHQRRINCPAYAGIIFEQGR